MHLRRIHPHHLLNLFLRLRLNRPFYGLHLVPKGLFQHLWTVGVVGVEYGKRYGIGDAAFYPRLFKYFTHSRFHITFSTFDLPFRKIPHAPTENHQDLTFGAVDPRRALNQVRVLDRHGYGNNGEWVGLDVKVMRTQKEGADLKHLEYSRKIFLKLLEISRTLDDKVIDGLIAERDYEELNYYILTAMLKG